MKRKTTTRYLAPPHGDELLCFLGVIAQPGKDEFDTVGLGPFQCTEVWEVSRLEQALLTHVAVHDAEPHVCRRFQGLVVAQKLQIPRILPASALITDPEVESDRWWPRCWRRREGDHVEHDPPPSKASPAPP